ncbi:hypothetical protein [Beduini massiliensis]|uniref:hypothetical protein n=1 Tax=Beduini massiliensis TaxID=1585974 RepID=UPI00059AA023|nr:hypothetical protein [Beduini massiliensis]
MKGERFNLVCFRMSGGRFHKDLGSNMKIHEYLDSIGRLKLEYRKGCSFLADEGQWKSVI